jgi:amino acid transporter
MHRYGRLLTMEIDLNKRYATMLTLWFALLMSVVMYFVLTFIAGPPINLERRNQTESLMIVVLILLGALFVVISFFVKRKFLERSVEKQDLGQVQVAMTIAMALCEVSALLGVVERFVYANREYVLLLIFAVAGMLLHFPRRSQLEAASYKNKGLQ